jgi:hypothetical protein
MRAARGAWVGLVLLGVAGGAGAQEPTPEHRVAAYSHAAAAVYLSSARTIGGVGGGLGVRDTVRDRFILQADASYLSLIGNVVEVRLGAGIQRQGMYAPTLLLTLSGFFGDRLSFLTEAHPTPVEFPALSLGLSVAPLRFRLNDTHLSLLELGVGAGTDLPGLGLSYRLTLLEVGASF